MPHIQLFTVEDMFWLDGNGEAVLLLYPDFSVPQEWGQPGWGQSTESVIVAKPDGQQIAATAKISLTHLNIPEPTESIDMRWRLTGRIKEEILVGSRILVQQDVIGHFKTRHPGDVL